MTTIWNLIRWRGQLQVLGRNQAMRMLLSKKEVSK
jgi:hypothetical protein